MAATTKLQPEPEVKEKLPVYVLTLDDMYPERPQFRIFGVGYEMWLPEEFGLKERRWLQVRAQTINKMNGPDAVNLTDLELDEVEVALREVFAKAFPGVPAEKAEQINVQQLQMFVGQFYGRFGQVTTVKNPAQEALAEARKLAAALSPNNGRSTGTTPSASFKPPTAPTPPKSGS